MSTPKIIIAGTHSGVGKTSVSLGLMAAFRKMGLKVQAFKVGPDYIDPSYHAVATGFPSHNLDDWMIGQDETLRLYEESTKGKDISIIEGVMGLFDGFSSTDDQGSTAKIAKILKAPIILVVDAGKMARSVSAMIKGYQTLDPELNICGVILNRVGSENHLNMLKESIAHYNSIPVLGSIRKDEQVSIPERHLGLKTACENEDLKNCLDALIGHTTIDDEPLKIQLNTILRVAKKNSVDLSVSSFDSNEQENTHNVKIAYAYDKAFQFYYQANLDYLESRGVTLIPFSPINDSQLPEDIGGLYFGGGFPEVYADKLQKNMSMRQSIKGAVQADLPIYAECGGLIYLTQRVKGLDGKSFDMVGAIPGIIEMTERLQNFGYCENTLLEDCIVGSQGDQFRGHEFHYSFWSSEGENAALLVDKKRRKSSRQEGYSKGNIFASYIHCHFSSNKSIAQNFILSSLNYSESRKESSVGSSYVG